MSIDQQFLFFFSALGAFNGVLLALYFFFLKPKAQSNYFLAAMLLMLSVRIFKSVIFYFDNELAKIYLQLGLSAFFFVGPFLYLFIRSKYSPLQQKQRQWLSWKIHLAILFVFITSIGIIYPYQSNPEVWSLLLKVISYQWLFYILLSAYILRYEFLRLRHNKEKFTENDIWLLSIFFGNVFIWLAHFTAAYTSYIVGALSFSFVFYLSFLAVIFHRRKMAALKSIKYVDKKIIVSEAEELITKLKQLMTNEMLYTNANLTMPQVAKKMSISTQRLSQLLNDNIATSFSNFVNEYRILKAQTLLLQEKKLKMDDIAEQCGFNSNSTFYTAFKKYTGTTPAKYRDTATPDL